jgi:hypothetical protein
MGDSPVSIPNAIYPRSRRSVAAAGEKGNGASSKGTKTTFAKWSNRLYFVKWQWATKHSIGKALAPANFRRSVK